MKPKDIQYGYALFLQCSFGDYPLSNSALNLVCIKSKCSTLKLISPDPYFKGWKRLSGMDPDVATEKFNEFMGIKEIEYTKQRKSGIKQSTPHHHRHKQPISTK
jgi:hypothetical protein